MNKHLLQNWSLVKLGDVCEILDNKRKPINSEEREKRILDRPVETLYPYYGATGQVGYIDDFLLDGEYILLGEDGAPFLEKNKPKAYIVTGKVWVNNHAHVLLSKYNNKFLCYYLNNIDYHPYVTGTTRLKLNQTSMKQIPVLNPPLTEQHKIVAKIEELFSELDKGVENLRKTKEQIRTYWQSVLAFAFSGRLTPELKIENGELRIENNFQLPPGWKWVKLGEVMKVSSGKGLTAINMKGDGKYSVYGGNGINGSCFHFWDTLKIFRHNFR
jgi:type I restriction enzyme S subunit